MASVSVAPILVRAKVACRIYDRKPINEYACPTCGRLKLKISHAAKLHPGCLSCDKTKHGLTKSKATEPIYRVWLAMKTRCISPVCKYYHNYGGRGITVCPEWHDNPVAFVDWAKANGYKPGLDIDRIDNNGNYDPSNCRWVTRIQNSRNRRTSKLRACDIPVIRMLRWSGLTYGQIGRIFDIDRGTIYKVVKFQVWGDV